jgi:hypothetical protein
VGRDAALRGGCQPPPFGGSRPGQGRPRERCKASSFFSLSARLRASRTALFSGSAGLSSTNGIPAGPLARSFPAPSGQFSGKAGSAG